MLTSSNFLTHGPTPLAPNTIEVPGMHLRPGDRKYCLQIVHTFPYIRQTASSWPGDILGLGHHRSCLRFIWVYSQTKFAAKWKVRCFHWDISSTEGNFEPHYSLLRCISSGANNLEVGCQATNTELASKCFHHQLGSTAGCFSTQV